MAASNPGLTALRDVAYYFPEPHWYGRDVDWLKGLLLFFDEIAILQPRYMSGRELAADPVLAGPLQERGLLRVLRPETFIDKAMTKSLTKSMTRLVELGVFDDLDRPPNYRELSASRIGWDADIELASDFAELLRSRDLARPPEDGASLPMHPMVRSTILVLLSQLARPAGFRDGMDLQPVTSAQEPIDDIVRTLSLPSMPSAGHVVGVDLEAVGVDLSSVPLDDVLAFREENIGPYRRYARDVREFITRLGPLDPDDRARQFADRRDDLAEQAEALRRLSRKAWRRPIASLMIGAVGAAWATAHGDPVSALIQLGQGVVGAAPTEARPSAYSYVFRVQERLSVDQDTPAS